MPSKIWKGSISFGLVNIPVSLQNAVRDDHISFRMLERDSLCEVRYERVCKKNDEPVAWEDIVKGFEYQKGKYVVLDEEDFEKAALATSRAFEIEDFVPAAQIDPRFFSKPYYAIPEEGAESVYALLREAIDKTKMIGIGRITLRGKQHLAAVKTLGKAIEINLMRFANEVIDEAEYKLPKAGRQKPGALDMAVQLIESLSSDFDAAKYKDEYRENLEEIIQSKLKGKKISLKESDEPKPTGVIDLMERLQQSLANRSGSKSKAKKKSKVKSKTTRKTAARTRRKTTARKRA